jgi:hypothetical protein
MPKTALRHSRAPWQWARDIEALPAHVQGAAASVVWWDFFGTRLSGDRWPELDRWVDSYLRTPQDPPDEDLIAALVTLGYGKRTARGRVMRSRQGEGRGPMRNGQPRQMIFTRTRPLERNPRVYATA